MIRSDTLIIGAGVSGLSLARQLLAAGRSFHLLEARGRPGGRILTKGEGGAYFDLGPGWFWPGQPRIAALTRALGLTAFAQYSTGDLIYEEAGGPVQRGRGYASMEGSFRLKGGLSRLTDAIAAELPEGAVTYGSRVTRLAHDSGGVTATTEAGESFVANRVVLALPPRVATKIAFAPALPDPAQAAMAATPTWMAGQAKAVAVYDRPFWREAGLSGDAMSRRGPLVEIHDASSDAGDHHALFGFVGIPPQARTDEADLRAQIKAQLARLFGPEAKAPTELYLKDWAMDPLTSTDMDLSPLHAHPSYGLPGALRGLWDGALIMAGTEVAPQFGGFLEGALEAAEAAFAALSRENVEAGHET